MLENLITFSFNHLHTARTIAWVTIVALPLLLSAYEWGHYDGEREANSVAITVPDARPSDDGSDELL